MRDVPKDLKFAKSHEWVKINDNNVATVGISEHAANLLGDLVYVELPTIGQQYNSGDECCVVESVKAAADVYCPVAGTITEVNTTLEGTPENINDQPYENGWIFKMEVHNLNEVENLISSDEYQNLILEEA